MIDHLVFERLIIRMTKSRQHLQPKSVHDMDDDVKAEMEKIKKLKSADLRSENLVLRGLSKLYGNFLAVNQLFLGVDNTECFGLLVSFLNFLIS